MIRNMNIYGGVVFSQKVLLTLIENGMSREEAYSIVQRNAHKAWNQVGGDFLKNLEADNEVTKHLNHDQLKQCFNTDSQTAQLNVIWERLEI